jgi:trehalose synthase
VTLKDVGIARLDPGRFQAVLDPEDCRRLLGRLARAAERLAGRRLWQVNSTEQGGGVAEMLHFLLGYLAGAGIDTRWVVIEGNQESSRSPNASSTCSTASPATGASWTSRHKPATGRP